MRKKLAVELALPVLAFGVIGAVFFIKDPTEPPATRKPAAADAPFGEIVERRLPAVALDRTTTAKTTSARPRGPSFRVPTAAAAPYSEGDSPAPEMSASYKRTFGSILSPLPRADADLTVGQGDRTPGLGQSGDESAGQFHKIADGDTLTKLAGAYLGSPDRFLEIYELNRSVLSSPDLLPIGAVLKIPPRERAVAGGTAADDPTIAALKEENLRLVPIPKGALGGAKK